VVGDRWTLLITRELMIRGACRYSDLRKGLPGIATNLLAERLRHLEAAGVVRRAYAPPPVATDLFSLTERGQALEPALLLLGIWGAPLLAQVRPEEVFQPHWMVPPLRMLLRRGGRPALIAILCDGEAIAIEADGRKVEVRLKALAAPATMITGPTRAIFALLTARAPLEAAERMGVAISGDRDALVDLLPSPTASVHP